MNSDDLDLQEERAKLAVEQTRKLQRENDLAEKEIAPVSILTEAVTRMVAQMIPLLDALPLDMKRPNPNLTGHDIMLVKKSIGNSGISLQR